MKPLAAHLFAHELQALLDALRRDLRMEISRAQTDPEWATYHNTNARLNMRLLELLEPRSLRIGKDLPSHVVDHHRTFKVSDGWIGAVLLPDECAP